MLKVSNKHLIFGIYLFLAVVVLTVFAQVCFHEFVNYDDDLYVTANDHVKNGFSMESIRWAFTEPHVANWHPLTSMSHMLDCQLFGLISFWHHLVNLLFHLANTLLLFTILKKISGKIWPCAVAALIFAIHPLRMESVAWVAERKDVLSGLFWLLTMYVYISYAQKPCIKRYIPVFVFAAFSLMSKPMAVTLPAVLLMMDYWPLKRLKFNEAVNTKAKKLQRDEIKKYSIGFLILEKVPLFLLVIGSSILTFIFQKKGGGINDAETWPFIYRLENAVVSYISYLGKTFYPAKLAVFYPHHGTSLHIGQVIISGLVLLAITILFFRLRKDRPYLLIGWLWFIGTMVPTIGLVQAGQQGMADRYTYIPSIGLCIALVWLVAELSNKLGSKVTITISACVIFALSASTFYQLRYWKNNETLFSHAVAVTENNHIMNNNYGNFLLNKGQHEKAIEHFSKAVQIKGSYALARENLARAYNDFAVELQKQNKIDQAMEKWQDSLAVDPNHSKANYNVGLILSKQGKFAEAVTHFKKTVQFEPGWYRPYNDLALAYEKLDQHDLAIENYNKALQIDPNYLNANYNLGCCYYRAGKVPLAVKYWQKTVEVKPDFMEILNNLALILAAKENSDVFNPAVAIDYAKRACQLTGNKQADTLSTLAVTYAAANQKDLAIQTAETAIQLAENSNKKELAQKVQQFLTSLKVSGDPNQSSHK